MRHRKVVQREHESLTLRSAIEVASVKAQVQQIVRKLRATLDELEELTGQLPDNGAEAEQ